MSQPRRKLFGPLFYSTLLAAVLVSIFAGIQLGKPRVEEWLRRHRLAAAMHNPRTRLAAMRDLRQPMGQTLRARFGIISSPQNPAECQEGIVHDSSDCRSHLREWHA
jgi:hypothetical protein